MAFEVLDNGIVQENPCPECAAETISSWPYSHCYRCGHVTDQNVVIGSSTTPYGTDEYDEEE